MLVRTVKDKIFASGTAGCIQAASLIDQGIMNGTDIRTKSL